MKWPLVALVVLTLLVRGGVLLVLPDALRDDPDRYRLVAQSIVEYGTFGWGETPTAYRPLLYPLTLAPLVAMGTWSQAAMGLFHLALGLATVGLTYQLGRQLGLGRWAMVAAGLVACDPLLLRQSTLIMTETPATFLAVAGLVVVTWASRRPTSPRAAFAGACLALAGLCRPTFLPWLAVCAAAWVWFCLRRQSIAHGSAGRISLRHVSAFVLAAVAVLAPWALRNYLVFGKPIVSTTHGGYNLLLGNNPYFYQYLRSGAWGTPWWSDELDRQWFTEAPHATPTDEVRADHLAYQKATEHIRREPGMFVYASAIRVARLFSPFPHQLTPNESRSARWARWAVTAWYLAEFPLAMLGLGVVLGRWSNGKQSSPGHPWLWAGLLVLCVTAVHAVYWTDLRMRAPLTPVIALAAATGLAAAWGSRSSSPKP